MPILWACVWLVLPAAAVGFQMPDELYFLAPPLFKLDEYERCLRRGASFCLGEFELRAAGPSALYDDLLELSSNRYLLNRSLLHRGVCVPPCGEGCAPAAQFEQAVDRDMAEHYGLRARLRRLDYCKSSAAPGTRPLDYTDVLMAAVILAILALNIVGTVYDLMRNPDQKPNRFLLAWSLRSNWTRLTAVHGGDPRLDALTPIHGIKAHQSVFVIMAHTLLAMNMMYVYDARTVDDMITNPVAVLAKNGTIVVQTFATLTSFLLAYMLLLHVENTKKMLTLSSAPAIILNRYIRMTPTIMVMVGVTATWVARAADGPLWWLVQRLEADCRAKWWTHLFYVNNLVNPDQRCTVQTWFLAVDMQVFLAAAPLTLLLLRRPRRAPRVLLALYAAVLAANLALNIKWQMVPMVHMSTADNIRQLYVGLESYNWMFSMPWTSLPASLHGLLLAFLHYNWQKDGFNPADHKWIRVAAWCVFPAMLCSLFSGLLFEDAGPLLLAVVATFDRTIFNAIVTFTIWVYINKLSGWVGRYLSWRGFQLASRAALSAALVHWHVNLAGLAAQAQLLDLTKYNFIVLWFSGVLITYLLALPLHLMVELPTQRVVDLFM